MKSLLQGQLPHRDESALSGILHTFSSQTQWDDVRVAVAYASVAGLLRFLDLLNADNGRTYTSRWLFGLDDYLTQPGVLRTCHSLPNSELRVARLHESGCRFHPKLLIVSQKQKVSLACVGSSNLTLGGLERNCEAFAALTANTKGDMSQLSATWDDIWEIGEVADDDLIDEYTAEYAQRAPALPKNEDASPGTTDGEQETEEEILDSDSAVLDPSLSTTCWIEVGKNTAKGYELEFKAEQALFFGLSPSGADGRKLYRTFVVSNGEDVKLPLRYQGNGMWRLQMNSQIPEVASGLRPRNRKTGKLDRSPYVAVFARSENRHTYFLRFIHESSDEYVALRTQSSLSGTSGRTRARRYGWC
jgi:HKD family nuclease